MDAVELQRKVETALSLQQSGQLQPAAALYREVLAVAPEHFDALHLFGVIVNQSGDPATAAELIGRAVQQQPRHPFAQNNLGLALQQLGRLDEAAACFRAALTVKPDFADACFNLGNTLLAQGQPDKAVVAYKRAVQLQPQDAQAHNNLGVALLKLGQLEQSAASLQQALALQPGHAEAYFNLGRVFLRVNDPEQAAACFLQAVQRNPQYLEAQRNLGIAYQKLGKFKELAASCRDALALNPDQADVLCRLGVALGKLGQQQKAEAAFARALELRPDFPDAHVGMAELHIDQGRFDAARQELTKVLQQVPEHVRALTLQSQLGKMTDADAGWLQQVLALVARPSLEVEDAVPLRFAIGKYYDDTAQYDLAFVAYREANNLKRQVEGGFDRDSFARLVDTLIAVCDRNFVQARVAGASDSRLPVLVVGMPRSGTSLIEQIIASHPQAFGAGELLFWGEQFDSGLLAGFDGSLDAGVVAEVASAYERRLREYSPDALRIVDKMPGNFLRMGFVHAIFPQASIIHAQRNPLDTCVSIYFQDLLASYSYGTDLEDLAFYYREYARLMDHWRAVMPAEKFLEVPYEGLVEDQETWSRRIIDFIGLPWDDGVMDFHRTDRRVGTSSNWQVRQKIYRTSTARWKRYERHLGPLLALLDQEDRA